MKKKLTNEEFIKIGYQKLSWTPANNCVVDEMAFTNHTDIFISKSGCQGQSFKARAKPFGMLIAYNISVNFA